MKTVSYTYKNDLGFAKEIIIDTTPNEKGEYAWSIWCRYTGDLTLSGASEKQVLIDFLKNYNINAKF